MLIISHSQMCIFSIVYTDNAIGYCLLVPVRACACARCLFGTFIFMCESYYIVEMFVFYS